MRRPNVDAMLDEMESWQLAEWRAYDRIEAEMLQREVLQSKADANLAQMKRGR